MPEQRGRQKRGDDGEDDEDGDLRRARNSVRSMANIGGTPQLSGLVA